MNSLSKSHEVLTYGRFDSHALLSTSLLSVTMKLPGRDVPENRCTSCIGEGAAVTDENGMMAMSAVRIVDVKRMLSESARMQD